MCARRHYSLLYVPTAYQDADKCIKSRVRAGKPITPSPRKHHNNRATPVLGVHSGNFFSSPEWSLAKPHTVPNWGLKSRFHLRHSVPSPTQPQGTQSPVPGLGPGTSPKVVEIGLRRGQSRAKIVIFWVASEASGGSSTAMTQVEAFCQCSLSPGNF